MDVGQRAYARLHVRVEAERTKREFTERITDGVGLGREHHIRTERLIAQASVVDQTIVHAIAFALAA